MTDKSQWLYHFQIGDRPELAEPDGWTEKDNLVALDHLAYLEKGAQEGVVILAGRSQDGIGPAIVIVETKNEEKAIEFRDNDPFVKNGLFIGSLHPYRVAVSRNEV